VHNNTVWRVNFSPDGKYIVTSSFDGTACVLPLKVEQVLYKIKIEKDRGEIWKMSNEDKKKNDIL